MCQHCCEAAVLLCLWTQASIKSALTLKKKKNNKVHTKWIFDPTRIDLLVFAQPCEKCMMHQVPWGHIQFHRKE